LNISGDTGPMLVGLLGSQTAGPQVGTSMAPFAMRTAPENVTRSALTTTTSFTKSELEYISPAFNNRYWDRGTKEQFTRTDTGLEFHIFYHPFSSSYVTSLNQGGVSRLLESDTTIPSDGGTLFEETYIPNLDQNFVQKPADFATGTYYKENVCFWPYGANSLYNWELFFHAPLYIATRLS